MIKRVEWIDELKGFAIFLVVFGHIIQTKAIDSWGQVHNIIYSFHMPLFMFLSGIFGYKLIIDKGVNLIPILKKKGLQLILPALVFGAVGCLIHKENYITSFLLGGGGETILVLVYFV